MKFVNIEMFFLVWTIPLFLLIYIYGDRKRKRILSRFASAKGLEAIIPQRGSRRRHFKAAFILTALFFIIAALAGPQYGYRWQETERRGVDIVLALDCSKSMLAKDIKPSRLDRAKREVYDLLSMMEGDRIGLVAFAGTAFLQCPLTLDYEAFHLFLNTLTPDYLPVGGTDLNQAIETALSAFDEKAGTEKAIILITDGESTGDDKPVKAAQKLQKNGVRLFCIGVGSDNGVPVPEGSGKFKKDKAGKIILSRLDEEVLKKIAVLTNGTYVRSMAGDMDLDAIYKNEIRGKMEQAALESGKKQVWENRYQWLLALAIAALLADIFLTPVRRKSFFAGLSAMIFFTITSLTAVPYAHAADNAMQQGRKSYEKGEYEKAVKYFIDAQLEDPDNPKIAYNLGTAYYKNEEFDVAAESFGQALNSDDPELKKNAHYNFGNTCFRLNKYEEAIKHYESAITIDPADERAKQNIEFVKKVIEQKKKEEEQKKDQDQNDDKNDKKEDKKDDDKKEGDQKDSKDKNDQEEKDKKSEKDKEENSEEKDGEKSKKEDGDPSEEEKKNMAEENQAEDGKVDPDKIKQAERMLNRLEDKPGKALMMKYRQRNVEKDW